MEELAFALKGSNFYFLWVVKALEEAKLPEKFVENIGNKGLVVQWSPQLEVLANKAIGCFLIHCGWNSTLEALNLGLHFSGDATMDRSNSKFQVCSGCVEDGSEVYGENGIVGREEIEFCIREVMEGERGREMKENTKKWRGLAIEAISEGGSSDKNIDEFVSNFINS